MARMKIGGNDSLTIGASLSLRGDALKLHALSLVGCYPGDRDLEGIGDREANIFAPVRSRELIDDGAASVMVCNKKTLLFAGFTAGREGMDAVSGGPRRVDSATCVSGIHPWF